jgi:hypothetical protein
MVTWIAGRARDGSKDRLVGTCVAPRNNRHVAIDNGDLTPVRTGRRAPDLKYFR